MVLVFYPLQALAEAGLFPARVTGSSSGAIIAGLYAGGLDPTTTLPECALSVSALSLPLFVDGCLQSCAVAEAVANLFAFLESRSRFWRVLTVPT